MTPDQKLEALKAATRAANEALADIKRVRKEIKQLCDELDAKIQSGYEEKMASAIADGLESYKKSLGAAIDNATESVFKRFDTIMATLLGEDTASKRIGKPSVPEMIDSLPYCVVHDRKHSPPMVTNACIFREGA